MIKENKKGLKKYIGTKIVHAASMTGEEASSLLNKELDFKHCEPTDADGFHPGYLVEYEGGYQSWSPAEPFEKAYQLYETANASDTIKELPPEEQETKENEESWEEPSDPMLQWFTYGHLPPGLQDVSKAFCELAEQVVYNIKFGRERNVCLRKLLEAKDAAVRACVVPGG